MKKILFITAFLLSFSSFGQKMYSISGKIETSSFYQGGMYREPVPDVYPCRNCKLVLVKFVGRDSIPEVVKEFSADDEGNFSLNLPAGNYGFVGVGEEPKVYQYLPSSTFTQDDQMNTSRTYWTLNSTTPKAPIKVRNENVTNLKLTYHKYGSCGKCP